MTVLVPTRRGLLQGLGMLLAAPAIVRAASLMPVRAFTVAPVGQMLNGGVLTMNEITREAVKLWKNSNLFLQQLERHEFLLDVPVRIRLPNDWATHV